MTNVLATIMVWIAMNTAPYPDLISRQEGLRNEISAPLSHSRSLCYDKHDAPLCADVDEFEALINGFWNRQAVDAWRFQDHIRYPQPHQQMAIFHLLNGGNVRAGDYVVVHGSLLSARRVDTYLMAKQLEVDMDKFKERYKKCVINNDPSCVEY